MARNSGIEWTDHTWNPWQGCHKVSPGCANCYMYRDKKRFGQDPAIVIRSKPATFNSPLSWKDHAKIFVCSWSDFFIKDADSWRDEAWEIMRKTPHLTYMLLTKRQENIKDRLPPDWPMKNVWLGVTVESQGQINRLVPLLFDFPAAKRFVSIEPMIGPVDLGHALCKTWSDGGITMGKYLDWVIVGGETGPNAREMKPEWVASIMKDCENTKTPFFMKQMTNKTTVPDYLQRREFPRNI